MFAQKYEALLKIVEVGNITRAAAELGYSQSAISHVVSTLESEWNVKLLHRDRQGVRLTSEGEALMPGVRRVVKENRVLLKQIAEMQRLERGIIHVGAFPSALNNLIPQLTASFSERYPKIQFKFRHGGYHDIEKLIADGQLDCGFVQIPTTVPIETIPLFEERILAIFPQGTRPEQKRFPISDLAQETFIMVKDIDYELADVLSDHRVAANQKFYSDYDYSIIPMVANGLGMCILPELLLANTPYQLEIKELDPPSFRTVGIGFNKNSLSLATQTFIDHVKDCFSNDLP
ncbi:MAG: cmpR [Firmicutes bacterium]|nr:cmpR [Bacillota bacterium]